mmetsp:Transcript_130662/g.194673  ORF Transcript_130662/g.194673 Transcript_130662/m.194673 type:complete len:256 (-) Transcript_130662:59-826(-)
MAVPFLISALSLAYSVVTPDMIPSLPFHSTTQVSRSTSSQRQGSGQFVSGVVFGMGLSTLLSYELRRRRVLERIRVAFFSWLNDSDEEKWTDKYRKPVKVMELEGEKLVQSSVDDESASAGFRCAFLSGDWALTSKFNVAVLTLTPGTELLPKTVESVEFYYVVNGDGYYVSGEDKQRISTGSAFIVDPGRERGFSVRGRVELVLLRATDSTDAMGDETRHQTSALSSTISVAKAALNKVETMVQAYSEKTKPKE